MGRGDPRDPWEKLLAGSDPTVREADELIAHGVEADGHIYCCAHCASMAERVAERA